MTTSTDDIIQQAMAAATAEQAAPQAAAMPGTDLVQSTQPVNAVSTAVAPAPRKKSLEDAAASSSMSVAGYIKVKHEGIYFADDKTAFDEFRVRIRGSEISLYDAVAYGNPAKYGRTYDGVTEAFSKRPWASFVNDAVRMDPKCKGAYDAADVPMHLVGDLISERGDKKGQAIFKDGDVIGFTTSKSAYRDLQPFIKNVVLVHGDDVLLEGTIKHKPLKNDKGEWGVLDFGSPDDWTVVAE